MVSLSLSRIMSQTSNVSALCQEFGNPNTIYFVPIPLRPCLRAEKPACDRARVPLKEHLPHFQVCRAFIAGLPSLFEGVLNLNFQLGAFDLGAYQQKERVLTKSRGRKLAC